MPFAKVACDRRGEFRGACVIRRIRPSSVALNADMRAAGITVLRVLVGIEFDGDAIRNAVIPDVHSIPGQSQGSGPGGRALDHKGESVAYRVWR